MASQEIKELYSGAYSYPYLKNNVIYTVLLVTVWLLGGAGFL